MKQVWAAYVSARADNSVQYSFWRTVGENDIGLCVRRDGSGGDIGCAGRGVGGRIEDIRRQDVGEGVVAEGRRGRGGVDLGRVSMSSAEAFGAT